MKKRILAILSVLAISLCCVLAACQSEKDLTLSGYDKDGLELIEYDKAYAPFWEGTTVYNESCVFIKGEDGKITLKTMFTPTKVIAVRDSTLEITYKEGTDYTYRDGVFTLTENSSIPYFTYNQAHYNVGKGITTLTDEERADLTGIDIQTYGVMHTEGAAIAMRQVCITYKHKADDWQKMEGFDQKWQGEKLSKTLAKLENKEPVEITLYGDSITSINAQGTGASSAGIGRAPYFPCWAQGFEDALEYKFQSDVTVHNLGLGGWNSYDGLLNAEGKLDKYQPDLFVLAFGMNDAPHGKSVKEYKDNLQGMIDIVRTANPASEVIIISTTNRNIDMVWDNNAVRHADYLPAVYELAEENENVAVCDMTAFTDSLFQYKASYECFYNNINHPIDYMVRAYVANMMKLFLR